MIEQFQVIAGKPKDVNPKVEKFLSSHPNAQVLHSAVSNDTNAKETDDKKSTTPNVAISVGIVTP